MYFQLLLLDLKSYFRNPQFGENLIFQLLAFFGMLSMAGFFVFISFAMYYYPVEELNENPIHFFAKYFVYYWAFDLVVRYFIQKMPTQNIKPFLTIGLSKKKLVNYTILRVVFNFYNWGNLLFLIPFGVLIITKGNFELFPSLIFLLNVFFIFYINNFINILLNGKDIWFYTAAIVFVVLGFLEYKSIISLSTYSKQLFILCYEYPFTIFGTLGLLVFFGYLAYQMIYTNFYLDQGLELKQKVATTNELKLLNRYGVIGTFINNDIRLILRSKAAKSSLIGSIFFLGYGFLFYSKSYQASFMLLFIGIFVTGNFMIIFGQRVPSWDSSYYPLMMTRNVPYIKYLKAKWLLIVFSIVLSMLISSLYLFLNTDLYLTILAAGFYNIGINSYLILLAGAFNKKPIDLNANTKSFNMGNTNFNIKTMLLMIPQMILPMAVFGTANYFGNIYVGIVALATLGIIGFLFRNHIFKAIVKIYKTQKHSTLESFKKGL